MPISKSSKKADGLAKPTATHRALQSSWSLHVKLEVGGPEQRLGAQWLISVGP